MNITSNCRSVGERFNLAKSTLSSCFIRVIKLLNKLAPRVIKWPQNTYIPIKAPPVDPQSYITRKCSYAFTLQAVSDSLLRFTDVFVGYPGFVSDTRIFINSDIYKRIRNNPAQYIGENEYIIGDKAYPVLPWCIPPYINRGRLTEANIYFNTKHAQTRQTIERSFALLFGRLRRLKFLDMNRTDLIPGTILAACVLHNICLDFDDLLIENYIEEGINFVHNINNENIHD